MVAAVAVAAAHLLVAVAVQLRQFPDLAALLRQQPALLVVELLVVPPVAHLLVAVAVQLRQELAVAAAEPLLSVHGQVRSEILRRR